MTEANNSTSRSARIDAIDAIARQLLGGATFAADDQPRDEHGRYRATQPPPDTATLSAAEHERLLAMMSTRPGTPRPTPLAGDAFTPGLRQWLQRYPAGRALLVAEDKRLADAAAAQAKE